MTSLENGPTEQRVCDGCARIRLCRFWSLRGWYCDVCEAIRRDMEDRIHAR